MAAADNPLKALWDFQSTWDHTALGAEFLALSNHRKSLKPMLASVTDEARDAQARALERIAGGIGIDPTILPPVALATILVSVARTLANEERVGIAHGHEEVRNFVEWALRRMTELQGN